MKGRDKKQGHLYCHGKREFKYYIEASVEHILFKLKRYNHEPNTWPMTMTGQLGSTVLLAVHGHLQEVCNVPIAQATACFSKLP